MGWEGDEAHGAVFPAYSPTFCQAEKAHEHQGLCSPELAAVQSREPSQEEQGAGLGDREEPLPPSAFPDILKQLPPLTP